MEDFIDTELEISSTFFYSVGPLGKNIIRLRRFAIIATNLISRHSQKTQKLLKNIWDLDS